MARKTHVLVSYDITDDKLRTQFASELMNLGLQREQYSLFSGEIPVKRVKNVEDTAEEYREKEDCSIKIIQVCRRCLQKSTTYPAREEEKDDYTIL